MLNAIGCLILAGVVFSQWFQESRTNVEMAKLRVEISMAKDLAASESKRALNLERDIAVLREALDTTRQAAIAKGLKSGFLSQLDDARDQNDAWQQAVANRDARITQLDAELTATRRRLDEAIARLRSR